jgi:hypothetical protein
MRGCSSFPCRIAYPRIPLTRSATFLAVSILQRSTARFADHVTAFPKTAKQGPKSQKRSTCKGVKSWDLRMGERVTAQGVATHVA